MAEVSDDDLYTIRWAINHQRPDIALGVVNRLLGVTATPPEEITRTRPDKLMVALVVGHNERLQGAQAVSPLHISEWEFNGAVADYLINREEDSDLIEYRRFDRKYSGSYRREIDAVYKQVSAYDPDLILELHFNAANGKANYSTMLAAHGSVTGNHVAGILQRHAVRTLQIADRGVINRNRTQRGGRALYAAKAPTVLTEPFFGDNPDHAAKVADIGVAGIGAMYHGAVREALPILI